MGSKEGLCLWCGHFTESRALDGLADCDVRECIEKRNYEPEYDTELNVQNAGVKTIDAEDNVILIPFGETANGDAASLETK